MKPGWSVAAWSVTVLMNIPNPLNTQSLVIDWLIDSKCLWEAPAAVAWLCSVQVFVGPDERASAEPQAPAPQRSRIQSDGWATVTATATCVQEDDVEPLEYDLDISREVESSTHSLTSVLSFYSLFLCDLDWTVKHENIHFKLLIVNVSQIFTQHSWI